MVSGQVHVVIRMMKPVNVKLPVLEVRARGRVSEPIGGAKYGK